MCLGCLSKRSIPSENNGYVKDTMWIDGYGNESVNRIKELESRVILPNVDSRDPQHYFVGRKHRGKVLEQEPNIYRD